MTNDLTDTLRDIGRGLRQEQVMTKSKKPDCYKCIHRRDLAGDCHSRCAHPKAGGEATDPFAGMMAMFASVGRVGPQIGDGAIELGIKGNVHGMMNGWFNWPFNFDPVWLDACEGFEEKK